MNRAFGFIFLPALTSRPSTTQELSFGIEDVFKKWPLHHPAGICHSILCGSHFKCRSSPRKYLQRNQRAPRWTTCSNFLPWNLYSKVVTSFLSLHDPVGFSGSSITCFWKTFLRSGNQFSAHRRHGALSHCFPNPLYGFPSFSSMPLAQRNRFSTIQRRTQGNALWDL